MKARYPGRRRRIWARNRSDKLKCGSKKDRRREKAWVGKEMRYSKCREDKAQRCTVKANHGGECKGQHSTHTKTHSVCTTNYILRHFHITDVSLCENYTSIFCKEIHKITFFLYHASVLTLRSLIGPGVCTVLR